MTSLNRSAARNPTSLGSTICQAMSGNGAGIGTQTAWPPTQPTRKEIKAATAAFGEAVVGSATPPSPSRLSVGNWQPMAPAPIRAFAWLAVSRLRQQHLACALSSGAYPAKKSSRKQSTRNQSNCPSRQAKCRKIQISLAILVDFQCEFEAHSLYWQSRNHIARGNWGNVFGNMYENVGPKSIARG